MSEIKTSLFNIYKKRIPESGFKIEAIEKSGIFHFEKYDKRFRWNNSGSEIDIFVPVCS